MDLMQAIKTRRSVGKMTDKLPSREQIEMILEAATYAPNHHEVEPWKFFVLTGNTRLEIGNIMAESLAAIMEETQSEKAQAAIDKERKKLMRSPVVIAVASSRPNSPKIVDIENVEAVSAAVQNMLLVANSLGLASIWRTGAPAFDPKVKAYLGLELEEHIVAFVYLGYPAVPVSERSLTPFQEKTQWLGWQD